MSVGVGYYSLGQIGVVSRTSAKRRKTTYQHEAKVIARYAKHVRKATGLSGGALNTRVRQGLRAHNRSVRVGLIKKASGWARWRAKGGGRGRRRKR